MSECSAVSRLRTAMLAGAAAAALIGSPAAAQDPGEASTAPPAERPDTGSDDGLREIVVTAERRATNLQDTPISIVAVTEETIQAKGIEDLQDLSAFTPNLSISASRGNGN